MSKKHVPLPLPDEIRSTMVKKCNVITHFPVRTVYPPLLGSYQNIMLTPESILKILLTPSSQVEEVLYDGTIIPLDETSYNVVHNPDDPKVKELAKKYDEFTRQNIHGDIRDTTMHKLKNHTAPLPRNHYLYSIKENYKEEEITPREEAEKRNVELREKILAADEVQGNPPKDTNLPVLNTETGEVDNRQIPSREPSEPTEEFKDAVLLGLPENDFGSADGVSDEVQEDAEAMAKRNSDRNKYKGRYMLR